MSKKTIAHLTATELHRLFEPVLPFAGRDDMLPVITGVHLSTHRGYLVTTATDRYKAGVNRIKPELVWDTERKRAVHESTSDTTEPIKVAAGVKVLIPAGVLQRALKMIRNPRGSSLFDMPTVALIHDTDDNSVTLQVTGQVSGGLEGLALTIGLIEADNFPDLVSLFSKAKRKDLGSYIGLNPEHMDAFKVAMRSHGERSVAWRVGAERDPITGYVGRDFVGLLMPRRILSALGDERTMEKVISELAEAWDEFLA